MKRTWDFAQVVVGMALLAALAFGLIYVFQAARGGALAPTAQITPELTQGYPPPDTPLPPGTAYPTEIIIEVQPWQTPTPWLTFTPPPQPTQRPGPTETPLPLPTPAPDAAGIITYLVSENDVLTGYSLSVDANGLPISPPEPLPGNITVPTGLVHPSPDGTRLAVEWNWGGAMILNIETGQIEPLASLGTGSLSRFLGWHPDSRRILYRGDGGPDGGLWLEDTDQFTVIYRDPQGVGAISDGAISPDGQKIIYSFWRGGGLAELRMLNPDGSNPHVLYTAESDIYLISWSPDGSQIAFVGDQGYMVIGADGANPRPLPISGPFGNYPFEPVWSPDGRWIAYVTYPLPEKGATPDSIPLPFKDSAIRLIDVVTGEDRLLLTDGSTGHIDPAWSPDGSQISFASIRSGTPEIWAINMDGTNLRPLTSNGQFVRFTSWRQMPSLP